MRLCVVCGTAQVPAGSGGVTCGHSCRAKLREARKTTEWRKPREYPAELVERVHHLYVDQGMTRAEVQAEIGRGFKVETIMERHDIPRRPKIKRNQRTDANTSWAGENPSYQAAHTRVLVARGKAATYSCIDCAGQAKEWSYIGGCPMECRDEKGRTYSPDPQMYAPRCVSCHRRHDAATRRAA